MLWFIRFCLKDGDRPCRRRTEIVQGQSRNALRPLAPSQIEGLRGGAKVLQFEEPAHVLLRRFVVLIELDRLAVVLLGFVDIVKQLGEHAGQIESLNGFGV